MTKSRKLKPKPKLPREPWTLADKKRTHAMLLMLGANEATKELDTPLGTKVFYRFIRDEAYEKFIAAGGTIDNLTSPPTLVLKTRPEFKFYETDIEAMRQLVAEHDEPEREKGAAEASLTQRINLPTSSRSKERFISAEQDESVDLTFDDIAEQLTEVEAEIAKQLNLRRYGVRGQLRALDLQGRLKENALVMRWHRLYAIHAEGLSLQEPEPPPRIEKNRLPRTELHGEEFLISVCYHRSPEQRIRRGDVMADVGLPCPDPPPTDREMQDVAFVAKMALLKILRQRKRKATDHG